MTENTKFGVILCGGQSRRMGQPKAWLPIRNGKVLLQKVTETVQEACDIVIIVAAPNQKLPQLSSEVRIANDTLEYQGPLNGFLTALKTLNHEVKSRDSIFLTACDVPNLTSSYIRKIFNLLTEQEALSVCPRINDQLYPLSAVYRPQVLSTVETMVIRNELRFKNLFEYITTRFVDANDLNLQNDQPPPWQGVNTPDEFRSVIS